MKFPAIPIHYRHWPLGMAVAVLGLLTTWLLAQQQVRSVVAISEARFLQEARAFSDALAQRMATHTEIVNGLRSLFMVNPVLSRAEFLSVPPANWMCASATPGCATLRLPAM